MVGWLVFWVVGWYLVDWLQTKHRLKCSNTFNSCVKDSGPTLTTLVMRIKDGQGQIFMQCCLVDWVVGWLGGWLVGFLSSWLVLG